MALNHIKLRPIVDLLPLNFLVPSYQRGYRWTEREVTALLNDILEFAEKDKARDEIYCLQPIVVKDAAGKWEVIDGQQRLTTIFIILTYINNNIYKNEDMIFDLSFQTRSSSERFLKNIDRKLRDENIDYHHICYALDTVETWFKNFPSANLIASKVHPVLLERVQIIWYEIKEVIDPIAIFTRINVGKIPLTNAELIKALLLSENNFPLDEDRDNIHLKQLEIASEWDRIEYKLADAQFWYFLNDAHKVYENRIEFLFDMIADEKNNQLSVEEKIVKEKNEYFSFAVFNKWIEEQKQNSDRSHKEIISTIWHEVKDYFQTFEDWFQDPELYHLIGFLLCTGGSIKTFKQMSRTYSKNGYLDYLHECIRSQLKCQLRDLEYSDRQVRDILLFFNIKTLLDSQSNTLFPFHKFKTEHWDIEHIHSVAAQMPNTRSSQEDWLADVLTYTSDQKLMDRIRIYINKHQNQSFQDFEILYNDIVRQFSEEGNMDDINDLSNLALLDSGTNRGYKNAVFTVKRKKIIQRDTVGKFIPVCTKNAFLKYYTDDPKDLSIWSKLDREHYFNAIKISLEKFLPKQS